MVAERGGFEPPVPVSQYDSLANCWFQPLTHLSKSGRTKIIKFLFLQKNYFINNDLLFLPLFVYTIFAFYDTISVINNSAGLFFFNAFGSEHKR